MLERKVMRVYVVDPLDKKIHERMIPKTKEAIINAIGNGCEELELRHMFDNGDLIYVDMNSYRSMAKGNIGAIMHKSCIVPIPSRMVIVGSAYDDRTILLDAETELEEFETEIYEEVCDSKGDDKQKVTLHSKNFIFIDKRNEDFIDFINSI